MSKIDKKQLSQILDYFETLKKVDTENVFPASQAAGIKNVLREDEEEKIEKKARDKRREKILKNVPEKEGKYIKVKSVQ
jgi:aspartyl-tRNA(Asn)/glutamyl-tRNA(Gln) amidotransferase subunit C